MRRFLEEFFWTPQDTATWTQKVVSEFDLWAVLWKAGDDAVLLHPNAIAPQMFQGFTEDQIQLFLGKKAI